MSTTTLPLIEKETISKLSFPKGEVLQNAEMRQMRSATLQQANTLGNLDKQKVLIHFVDSEGNKAVYTTIWAVTEAKVLLKAGMAIPIERIQQIKFVEP